MSKALRTSSEDRPSTSRMVITVRCISGNFAISASIRSTASSEASARSGSSHQRTGGAAHAPAPVPPPTKRSGSTAANSPSVSSRASDANGTERRSRWPRVRARLTRMLNTQVRSEERSSKWSSPCSAASHVSWTTSSAMAAVGTYMRATRIIAGDQRTTRSMNASSSPARRRSTSAWSSATGGPYNVANVHSVGDRLIGVDVGGTKVSVAVLEDGVLSEPVLSPTVLSDSGALVEQLAEAIEDAGPAAAVGIGVPSVIDFQTGTARSSVNIPLQGVPLRQLLTDRVGIPAFVDNDATVAALAEAHDDDLNLIAASLVMITVGTGVGGGIVIDGRIYRGVTGAAPELGHIIVGADLTDGAPARAARPPPPAPLGRLAPRPTTPRWSTSLPDARSTASARRAAWATAPRSSRPPAPAIPMHVNACASSGNASERASPTS